MPRKLPSVVVPFKGGLDTKSDLKMTPVGKLQILENGIFTEDGKIKKRWGYGSFAPVDDSDASITDARALSSWGNNPLLLADRNLYAKSDLLTKWVQQDRITLMNTSDVVVPEVDGEQIRQDSISNGNITVYVWEAGGGVIRATVTDYSTGFVYVHDTQVATGSNYPRCVVSEGVCIIVYVTSGQLIVTKPVRDHDIAGSLAAAATTLFDNVEIDDIFDAVSDFASGTAYVSTITNDGGEPAIELIEVAQIDGDGVGIDTYTEALSVYSVTSADMEVMAMTFSPDPGLTSDGEPVGERLAVSALSNTGTTGFIVWLAVKPLAKVSGKAISPSTTGTVINSMAIAFAGLNGHGAGAQDGSYTYILSELDGGSTTEWNDYVLIDQVSSGTALGNLDKVNHANLGSRCAQVATDYRDRPMVAMTYPSPGLQTCYFLYDLDLASSRKAKPITRFMYGEAEDNRVLGGGVRPEQLPGIWTVDGSTWEMSGLRKRRLSKKADTLNPDAQDFYTFSNAEVAHHKFSMYDAASVESAQMGDTTYINSGVLYAFDGLRVTEAAFLLFPEMQVVKPLSPSTGPIQDNGAAGNLQANQTYSYRVYYERKMANGEVIRSLALTYTHTMGGSNEKVDLTIPYLSHTHDRNGEDNIRIAIYRTEANQTQFFHLVTNEDVTDLSGDNKYIKNDPTTNELTFTDNLADSVIVLNKVDEQSNGVMATIAPRPGTVIGEAANRLWLAGGEGDKGAIYPSLLRDPGTPLHFADELQFNVEEEGGEITALGAIDSVLMVFKERRVYAVSGAGVANTALGQGFNIQRVTSDVGCTSSGSVVETPQGLMFQSAKGIYIIDRSFDTKYIGWPVEVSNDLVVVSAEVIPDTNTVIFLTSSGYSIVYDYFYDQWGHLTNHNGLDASVAGDEYHYLRSDGTLFTRDTEAYLDDGQWYSLRLRTAPIRLDSVQDYLRVHRVNILGDYLSSHQLQMKVFNNRDLAPLETRIWTPSVETELWGSDQSVLWGADLGETWGGAPGTNDYQVQHKFKRQKVQTVSLEFKDLQTSGAPGQSYELSELNFGVRLYEGNARVPAARKL
jgi:hypothetical protein